MIREAMKGAVIATAVASLFASGTALADKHEKGTSKVVRCAGVNECKGKGACAGADNACKSHNACKGKGWTEEKSAQACTDKGGTVLAGKAM